MKNLFLLAACMISYSHPSFARITADVQAYCDGLKPATPSEANDCMQFSQMCSFRMATMLSDSCGANGAKEQEINAAYSQVSAMIAGSDSYAPNAKSAVMNCQRVDQLRAQQKAQCANTIQYCESGRNPTPQDGRPEVFYAPIKTKTGTVKVTCSSYPNQVCDRFGRQELAGRIPAVMTQEKSVCDRAFAIQKTTGDNTARVPASQDGSKADYTADEIICHFKPDSEGCPKK